MDIPPTSENDVLVQSIRALLFQALAELRRPATTQELAQVGVTATRCGCNFSASRTPGCSNAGAPRRPAGAHARSGRLPRARALPDYREAVAPDLAHDQPRVTSSPPRVIALSSPAAAWPGSKRSWPCTRWPATASS